MKSWPVQTAGNDYNKTPVRNATVILADGSTLKGEVKFGTFSVETTEIRFPPAGKSEKKDIQKINGDSIVFIRFYPDILTDTMHHVDYYYIKQNGKDTYAWYLARRPNGGIAIRDVDYSTDTLHLRFFTIFLITPKETIEKVSYPFGFMTPKSLQKELLKIINSRYHYHDKQEDFKDAHAMANYILDKENEKR